MRKVIVGLCGIVCACISCADSIVNDSFESYAVDSSLIGQGRWTAPPGLTAEDQGVWSSAPNSPLGAAGSKAANVKDEDANARLRSPQLRCTYKDNSSDVVIDYDFMAPTFKQAPQFALQANGGSVSVLRLSMSASLQSRNGSSWDKLASLSVDTWYHFKVTVSLSSNTYDLVVSDANGVVYSGTGLGMAAAADHTDRFNFSFNTKAGASGGNYSVDNVTLTDIPSPVTTGQ